MKRILLIIVTTILSLQLAFADEAAIRSIKIGCVLDKEGTAHIHEWWDVTTVSGTEWYLVRENLGDIQIESFSVQDETTGEQYIYEDYWNVNRTLEEKAGRCGINKTDKGCELCWGFGTYGDHKFYVRYKMRNAAKSLNDYDMLHLQFVSDQLSSQPEKVKLVLEIPGEKIDSTNARIWGFGYKGECVFKKDRVYMESDGAFDYNSSLILLLRLDKGIINPTSSQNRDFQEHLDYALEGSKFTNDPPTKFERFVDNLINVLVVTGVVLYYGGWIPLLGIFCMFERLFKRRRWTGNFFRGSVPWNRDIPYEGDLLAANYVILELSSAKIARKARIASAMILRMIHLGAIEVRKDKDGKVELFLTDINKIDQEDNLTRELWMMINEAAGKDHALQDTEFSTWSNKNTKRVAEWVKLVKNNGKRAMQDGGYLRDYSITAKGIKENRKLYGLKNFLNSFTLTKERHSIEAVLWQDYLVFGALFGIADKVAKELKDINPESVIDPDTIVSTVYVTNDLGKSIMNAKSAYDSSVSSSSGGGGSSYRGGGGHSSYSGGGGYSGGGHGGGCR